MTMLTPDKPKYRKLSIGTIWLLAGTLLLGAGIAIGMSTISVDRIKAQVDRRASDGRSSEFDAERVRDVLFRCRVAGIGMLLVGATLVITRDRVQPTVQEFYGNLLPDGRWCWRKATEFVRVEKFHAPTLLFLMLLGLGLRLWFLGQPMRTDEAWSFLDYALKPFPYALLIYKDPNNHVLHNVLVGMVIRVFGESPYAIRIPALIAGWLLIPATYVTVRMMFSRWAGLIAAALVATSPYLILFSTNARGYMMVCLAFMVLLALSAYVLRRPDPAGWIMWAIVAALGFFTMPIMLYAVGTAWVWLVLSMLTGQCGYERKRMTRYLAVSTIAAALMTIGLYTPIFIINGMSAVAANKTVAPLTWTAFLNGLPGSLVGLWDKDFQAIPIVVGILLTAGFVVGNVMHAKVARTRIPLLVAVVVSTLPVLAMQRVVPFVRVWIYLWPVYLSIAAAGLVWMTNIVTQSRFTRRNVWSAVVAIALAITCAISIYRNEAPQNYPDTHTFVEAEAVAELLKDELKQTDRVAIDTPSRPILRYYFRQAGLPAQAFTLKLDKSKRVLVVTDRKERTIQQVLDRIHRTLDDYQSPRELHAVGNARIVELIPDDS